jgi:hypothetical protein
MNPIDIKIQETKLQLKKLKECRKQYKLIQKLEREEYRPPPYIIFSGWVESVLNTLENLVIR